MIVEARGTDATEGLKVNDVTPDWLRIRGIDFVEDYSGPYNTGFNWGASGPVYLNGDNVIQTSFNSGEWSPSSTPKST